MPFNLAIIGAGRIGRIHAANAAQHPALQLQFVVDPNAEAANSLATQHGAQVCGLDQVYADKNLAGIIIASSTDTHLEYALRAARAGKAVFCEKPLDLDLARARHGAAELKTLNAPFLLAFNRRFDPNFRALKNKLDAGAAGTLESLHIISHDPAPPPVSYIKTSGGLFKDMTIHDFDMARWLLGEAVNSVFASASCLVDPEIGKAGDIDTAKIILRTASGRLCVISNSRRSGYGYDQRIEAFGSKGMVRAENVMETTVQSWGETGAATDAFQNFFLDRYRDAYRNEMHHFAGMLSKGEVAYTSFADGVAALELAEAALESVQTGKVVQL